MMLSSSAQGAGLRRARSASVVVLLAWLVTDCSDFTRFREVSAAAPRPVAAATPQTPSIEREHERILASYGGIYEHPRLEESLNKIVRRLVAASERPDLGYKVTILNSSSINAFALPSGQLYVTRGLIALANDASELASVLAHEMAHVVARHAVIRENQARQAALVSRVVSDLGNDPELTALALAKTKVTMASFSRAQEFEADGIGVGTSARAGYDAFGAVRFLTSMERNARLRVRGADLRSLEFLASHPATPERIGNARANAKQFSTPVQGERDHAAYVETLDGIIYGEDPSEGFVRGRRFIHPRLGFAFTAPDRFTLENTAQAVIGVRENDVSAMRFDVVRVPAEQSLVDYLNAGWMENVDKGSAEEVMINGFPGATATATGEHWQFRVYALRFGSDVYRFIFATKQKNVETDRAAREAVSTFRRLTLAEIQAARPLRLKIVTVRPGDTVESLAQRMAGTDRQIERFRVLNGLDQHETPRVNDSVKLVVE